jgi:membrane protein YqaA with SNARE-associated domain
VDTGHQYLQSVGDGVFCKLGQVCIQDVLNQPEWGYMTFDNIFYAMLNIFTVISTENWTDLMYISQDSVSSIGSALFYSFCIYMMTFIMVPMFIGKMCKNEQGKKLKKFIVLAVITTSFSHIRGDMRESAFSVKRKTRLLLAFGRKRQSSSAQGGDEHHDDWIYERATNTNNLQQIDSKLRRISFKVVNSSWFPYIGSILVIGNVICMAFFSSDIPSKQKIVLGKLQKKGHITCMSL